MKKTHTTVITSFNIIVVLWIILTSCRTTNNTIIVGKVELDRNDIIINSNITIPKEEEIPILAWFGVQEHTVERYRELRECGINHNLTLYMNVEQFLQALNVAKESGVKMIITLEGIDAELENTVNRFKDHPALAGYFVADEPNSKNFPHLGELVKRIQAVDKKNICYVNILPANAALEHIGTKNHLEYVQLFLQEVPVEILSFDQYPILLDSSGVRFMSEWWYQSLKTISDEARKAGIPFWAFALATTHGLYPLPTLADLRLQVYSNLAYGAQGIQYFTYWTPSFNTEGLGYNNGPIDYTGQRTPTWYLVKQMNEEIQSLSGVFLGAQVIKVEHITIDAKGKNGKIPKGTMRFNFAKRPAEAFIIKKFDIPNNTNAVVSFLKKGKRAYMVVINRNLSGGENVTFTITGCEGLQLIKKDGTAVLASSENSKQTVTPGDALIYGWDIK